MARPRILLARPLPDAVMARAHDLFDVEQRAANTVLTRAEMCSSLVLYDGIMPTLGDCYNAEIFDEIANPRCRLLANFGVGYNHIDVDAARARGITVTNTPGAVTDATADIAMTLILMSARRAGQGDRLVRSGGWTGWHPTQMLGMHVTGKRLGIVGMGRIGQAIARRACFGFNMAVQYTARSDKQLDFSATRAASLSDLAAWADILVIAVPGGENTRHMVNADVLTAMQPHAHLINIARGDVVDEPALITALQTGQIAGAGLDVYENEPSVPPALRQLENVTLLPHLGTAASEVRTDMGMMVLDNMQAFFDGKSPPNAL